MNALTKEELERLAKAMKVVLDSPADSPAKAIALGVVLLMMGPLPEPRDRRCRLSRRKLAAMPAQWKAGADPDALKSSVSHPPS